MIAKVTRNSWIRLVYPFSFEPKDFERLIEDINHRVFTVKDASAPSKIWEEVNRDRGIHKSNDWAEPAVRAFLDGGENESSGMVSWELSNEFRDDYLTRRPKECGEPTGNLKWEFARKKEISIPLQINRRRTAVLTLMRHGAGLIALEMAPSGADLVNWMDFITRVRMANRRDQGLRVSVKKGQGEEGRVFTWPMEEFFNHPDNPEDPYMQGAHQLLIDLLSGSAQSPGLQWWKPVLSDGVLMPFYSIQIDGASDTEKSELRFRLDRLASNASNLDPSESQLRDDAPGHAQVSRSSWFLASRGGVGFIAFDTGSNVFLSAQLPTNVKDEGWCIFALAMQQRIVLQLLSERVTMGYKKNESLELFEKAKDALMTYTAEAWFPQVTIQSQLYADLYQLMGERFGLVQMNEAVRSEVNIIHEHLRLKEAKRQRIAIEEQKKASESLEKMFQVIGIPVALISITIGVLGINIRKLTARAEGLEPEQVLVWLGFALAIGVLLAAVVIYIRKR